MDLSSDPFGWEEEGDHSEEDDVDDTTGRDDDDDDAPRCRNSLFLHGCTMNKLSLVAMAIRRAAAAIEARLGTTAGGRNPSGDTRESLRPSEQRSLEDVSDALAHLRLFGGAPSSGGGVGGRGPSSASASAANNDVDGSNNTSAVVVVSGILDLV